MVKILNFIEIFTNMAVIPFKDSSIMKEDIDTRLI